MSYGIELFNNNNHRVINDYSYNLHYVGKYTSNSNYPGTSYSVAQYFISKTVCPSEPFVFMESTPNGSLIWMINDDSANNRWIVGILYSGTRPTILVFSTLTTSSTPQENYGMAIYNSNDALVFDSTRKPLKIKYIGQAFFGGAYEQPFPPAINVLRTYDTGVRVNRPAFFVASRCVTEWRTRIGTYALSIYLAKMLPNDPLFRVMNWSIGASSGFRPGDRGGGNVAVLVIDADEFDY
jgi:hypothetical protein